MTTRRRLDDNLVVEGSSVLCQRCNEVVGNGEDWLAYARIKERPAGAGAMRGVLHVAPELFVDAPVVTRQAFCPGCLTLLLTEVVAQADDDQRHKHLAGQGVTAESVGLDAQ